MVMRVSLFIGTAILCCLQSLVLMDIKAYILQARLSVFLVLHARAWRKFIMDLDPQLDLQFQRDLKVPVSAVWRAWTTPALLMQWFCPKPWKVVECDIDLRPGGRFRTLMQSPEGQNLSANEGCYLVVEPNERLVWTNALGAGFRPRTPQSNAHPDFTFVVDLRLQMLPNNGTRYTPRVMHADQAGRDAHAAMGFEHGWGIALDQLVDLMQAQA
jgi:uncharacterized protein YndB with AHSA1/START domain